MSLPRKTAQEKKKKGTFVKGRDDDMDFSVRDGLVKMTPKVPDYFTEVMANEWKVVWRHLIKHEYGKESDKMLVEVYIKELFSYFEKSKSDLTYSLAHKSLLMAMKASEQLGLAPAAMAKVAVLQKKEKGASRLKELLHGDAAKTA